MRAIDDSLRRLQTDYIDLYQLHAWDSRTPIDETLSAMDDLVRAGKVRYTGCSNYLGYQLARAVGRSEVLGVTKFASVQPRYNLLYREIERELLPACQYDNIAVIPYNPLAGGLLSGKHRLSGGPTEGTRFTLGNAAQRYQNRYWHEQQFETVAQLQQVAEDLGIPLVQLAVAWVLANPAITSPIIGASRPEQLLPTLAAIATPLSSDVKAHVDELTSAYRRVEITP
jgi:aryl-alcohol dehydrogenase (NADP+)